MLRTTIREELESYRKSSTGSEVIDGLLDGGFEHKTLTTIFGPAGSGKTNIALLVTRSILEKGKKVIFIDTENSFSIERFCQIGGIKDDYLDNLIIFKPTNFKEQKEVVNNLKQLIDAKIGLVVVDSIAMLYRLEMNQSTDISILNKEFSLQISYLVDLAIQNDLPLIMTNQVYSDFEKKDKVNMVGGDLLRYASKCLIELKSGRNGLRQAIVKKHRSIAQDKSVMFSIVAQGIADSSE